MMRKNRTIPLLLAGTSLMVISVASPGTLRCQETDESPRVGFLPRGSLSPPFIANDQEARSGLLKDVGSSLMTLEIGSALDIAEFRLAEDGSVRLRIGIDFFMHALTTSVDGLRLQIDAADGFFGGHITTRWDLSGSALVARLRLLHQSGHMVDGHWDPETEEWRDGREPIAYTRDFGELTGALSGHRGDFGYRGYVGFAYATLVRPEDVQRWSSLLGLEATYRLSGPEASVPLSCYVADNLSVTGVPEYVGTNILELGLRFGEWDGRGIRVFGAYRDGLSGFTQYYDVRTEVWSLGFVFDVW